MFPDICKKYSKEVVPDPHNPGTFSLHEKNGYFLTDFGLEKYPFCFTIRFSPERGEEKDEKSKRFKPAYKHGQGDDHFVMAGMADQLQVAPNCPSAGPELLMVAMERPRAEGISAPLAAIRAFHKKWTSYR